MCQSIVYVQRTDTHHTRNPIIRSMSYCLFSWIRSKRPTVLTKTIPPKRYDTCIIHSYFSYRNMKYVWNRLTFIQNTWMKFEFVVMNTVNAFRITLEYQVHRQHVQCDWQASAYSTPFLFCDCFLSVTILQPTISSQSLHWVESKRIGNEMGTMGHTLRNLGVLVVEVLDAVVHFESLEWFLCPCIYQPLNFISSQRLYYVE